MFSTLITVALFVSLAIQGTFAGFAINDPELNPCNPGDVSWSPGESPYTMEIVKASSPCGTPLVTLAGLTSTTYKYKTNLAPGTKILLYIADSGINEAWSNEITIGNSSACAPSASSTTPPSTPQTSSTPSSSPAPGLGGAINAGSSSSGMFTVHRASTPQLLTALAALLALTL